eukprot:UN15284
MDSVLGNQYNRILTYISPNLNIKRNIQIWKNLQNPMKRTKI